jgi:hypothetical protein
MKGWAESAAAGERVVWHARKNDDLVRVAHGEEDTALVCVLAPGTNEAP